MIHLMCLQAVCLSILQHLFHYAHINHYLVENTKREIIKHARMQIVEYLANLQHAYSKNSSRTFMLLPNIKLWVAQWSYFGDEPFVINIDNIRVVLVVWPQYSAKGTREKYQKQWRNWWRHSWWRHRCDWWRPWFALECSW